MYWLLLIPLFVYGFYIISIQLIPVKPAYNNMEYTLPITVLIPAHNESAVMRNKIKNIIECYKNVHIIVIDDSSTDETADIAEDTLRSCNISHTVHRSPIRRGVNASINTGVELSPFKTIISTDADVTFHKNAITNILRALSDPSVGGVCGELIPLLKTAKIIETNESAYRNIYGKLCTVDNAIFSTFCFNGPLVAFKKPLYSPISEKYGASDASIAFSILGNGGKCVYEPTAKFYEPIAADNKQMFRQKTRRATRLIEAMLLNIGLVRTLSLRFGLVYGLRFGMFFITPIVLLSVFVYSLVEHPLITTSADALLLIASLRIQILSSFLYSNVYLLIGICKAFRNNNTWTKIDRWYK